MVMGTQTNETPKNLSLASMTIQWKQKQTKDTETSAPKLGCNSTVQLPFPDLITP